MTFLQQDFFLRTVHTSRQTFFIHLYAGKRVGLLIETKPLRHSLQNSLQPKRIRFTFFHTFKFKSDWC